MKTRGFCLLAIAVAAVAFAGCASSAATPGVYNPGDGAYLYPQASAAPTYVSGGYSNDGSQPPAATAGAAPQPGSSGAAPAEAVTTPEDRIIKTGTIHIQVAGIDESIVRATDLIHGLGGWSAGSDRSISSSGALASITYRVPVNRFDDALAAMRTLGLKVLAEHSDSASVGAQMIDLQARIDNLKAKEKAIRELMTRAKTIGEVLTVQESLSETQGQIEQLSAQLTGMTDQSAFSTLTVIFEVPAVATATPTPSPSPTPTPSPTAVAWTAKKQFDEAAGALTELGQMTATAAIWVAVLVLPILLFLLLVLIAVRLGVRFGAPAWRILVPFVALPTTRPGPTGSGGVDPPKS